MVAGTSENGELDPLFSGFPEFRAVLWREGHIKNLGTLPDGFESSANAVNSKGEVIGWAMNSTSDADSMAGPGFFPMQTRAFLWHKGVMQDLGTLGTGTDAIAQFINERGQIVGWSYTGGGTPSPACIFPQATSSFIWDEKNQMRDLGNLGGTCAIATGINNHGVVIGDNVDDALERAFIWRNGVIQDLGGSIGGLQTGAEGINDAGQVAGFATLAGESIFHAALWKRPGEITDLGALGEDECSFATGINSKTQVVGGSAVGCVFDSQSRAVLWEHGSIVDLNTLIAPGASLTLELAQGINDRGEIAGIGVDASLNVHAYLMIPCDGYHPDTEDCGNTTADSATATQVPASRISVPVGRKAGSSRRTPKMLPLMLRHTAARDTASSDPATCPEAIDAATTTLHGRCDVSENGSNQLTGYCRTTIPHMPPNHSCGIRWEPNFCPVGNSAIQAVSAGGCLPPRSWREDLAKACE